MTVAMAVLATHADCLPRATELAETLGLPRVDHPDHSDWLLAVTPDRLELRATDSRRGMTVAVDFVGGPLGYRRARVQGRNEQLARAVMGRQGPLAVLDATAGLGRDAFILASLGCSVTLLERSPVVAALLRDGLERGLQHPATASCCARMQLTVMDARQWLLERGDEPWCGVIYLDPMYPARRASALAGKQMQVLQSLLGSDQDGTELLDLSRRLARVVLKRPRLAPHLGDYPPDRQLTGRSTRFDIYLPASR